MNKNKKNFLITGILFICSVVFTILVKIVDVKPVGYKNTDIGFSTINKAFENAIGYNEIFYKITEVLGIVILLLVVVYALIGLIQLIKRKSLLKVDKELILLAIFYVLMGIVYIVFEKIIINYRPVGIEGLEASFPSSHTLLSICICLSSVLINNRLIKDVNKLNIVNGIIITIMTITVLGRLLSGVHWLTDIIGGILISSTLVMLYHSLISLIKYKKVSRKEDIQK